MKVRERTSILKKQARVNVITLGCSKNIYDSEILMGQLKANNKDVVHEDVNDEGNIVVINTVFIFYLSLDLLFAPLEITLPDLNTGFG